MSSLRLPSIIVGPLLRERRELMLLSQKELAEKLKVSVRSVQAWEAGTLPHPRHRRALAAFFAANTEEAA
jgi:transcriptional regulator with XRE-family HTH domain